MSAWTWTYVKADKLPKDITDIIVDKTIKRMEDIWYYKKGFNKAIKLWLEHHERNRDYYINQCGVPEEQLTKEYLAEELQSKVNEISNYISDLKQVKENKLTLGECLKRNKAYGDLQEPMCSLIKDTVWVNLPYEIFRLREYTDFFIEDGIKTIDELIKFLSEPHRQDRLMWWENENLKPGMFPEFETRLREFYGQFGDNNFSVHFG